MWYNLAVCAVKRQELFISGGKIVMSVQLEKLEHNMAILTIEVPVRTLRMRWREPTRRIRIR